MEKIRKSVMALVISVVGLGTITIHEGYSNKAYIPIPGDVPTIGYGNTTYANGSRVQIGDTITRIEATELLGIPEGCPLRDSSRDSC